LQVGGVRELSAVVALTAIGVPASIAIAVAVLIGLLALASVMLVAGIAVILPANKSHIAAEQPSYRTPTIEALVKSILPILAATLVFFQIHVPTNTKAINVNLADPIAILGGLVFFSYYVLPARPNWRLSWLNQHAGIASLVMILAFDMAGATGLSQTSSLVGLYCLDTP
jgi:uncharacterized BrkB/YihY/UPF0761 family membrane protein